MLYFGTGAEATGASVGADASAKTSNGKAVEKGGSGSGVGALSAVDGTTLFGTGSPR